MMVGKVPRILGAEHVQPRSMTASDQLPAATDEPTPVTVASESESRPSDYRDLLRD